MIDPYLAGLVRAAEEGVDTPTPWMNASFG